MNSKNFQAQQNLTTFTDQMETIQRGDLTQHGALQHVKNLEKFDNFDHECGIHMSKNDMKMCYFCFFTHGIAKSYQLQLS